MPDDHTAFADAYPILLIGQASLDDLSERVGVTMNVRRFRPNVVFSGAVVQDYDGPVPETTSYPLISDEGGMPRDSQGKLSETPAPAVPHFDDVAPADLTAAMGSDVPFMVNRAIIQKGRTRMMVFYWFEQKGRKIAWDMAAKYHLMVDGIRTGRTDGALVRLTTPILQGEPDSAAEARLMDMMREVAGPLPRFIPDA